jgi:hypothetical protein
VTPFKTPKDKAAAVLNKLPEVRWDRCVRRMERVTAFGWIDREDGRSDFVVVYIDHHGAAGFATSSAKYSREFSERLFGTSEGHRDCERIEDVFGDLVPNKVALAASQCRREEDQRDE